MSDPLHPHYTHPPNPLESSVLYPASAARGAEPPWPWLWGGSEAPTKGLSARGVGVPGTRLWRMNPQGVSPIYLH